MKVRKFTCDTDYNLLIDWTTLGNALHIKTQYMAWALKQRDAMQHQIRLKGRVVYKSDTLLRFIQTRLIGIVNPIFEALPDNDCALAYRTGESPVTKLRALASPHTLVTTDICKYYDNVTLTHIEECLVKAGFQRAGARLVGRYCVVKRGNRQTLQQGSPVSPALSNLVGYHYIDAPIKTWLKEHGTGIRYTYIRYSDNIALFLHSAPPEGFVKAYKDYVKEVLQQGGFRTHNWSTIGNNHPKRNQKFLGVVLNKEARVEKEKMDSMRAFLFDCCVRGFSVAVRKHLESLGVPEVQRNYPNVFFSKMHSLEGMQGTIVGTISYISTINKKHALMLQKLYALAKEGHDIPFGDQLPSDLFAAIKSYRDNNEEKDAYVERVKNILKK